MKIIRPSDCISDVMKLFFIEMAFRRIIYRRHLQILGKNEDQHLVISKSDNLMNPQISHEMN